jgi:intracellular multiplication protein IcmJ
MPPFNLLPGVKVRPWRRGANETTEEYLNARQQALRRDKFTCRGCGFHAKPDPKGKDGSLRASGYLETHHRDDDHTNNELSNLVTLCPFCHSVCHIGFAGHARRASVIYCPWLTQAQLNLLANVLAVAMRRDNPQCADDAKSLYRFLTGLEAHAPKVLGLQALSVENLATALASIAYESPQAYEARTRALAHLRILPLAESFDEAIAWWDETGWHTGEEWSSEWDAVFEAGRTVMKTGR